MFSLEFLFCSGFLIIIFTFSVLRRREEKKNSLRYAYLSLTPATITEKCTANEETKFIFFIFCIMKHVNNLTYSRLIYYLRDETTKRKQKWKAFLRNNMHDGKKTFLLYRLHANWVKKNRIRNQMQISIIFANSYCVSSVSHSSIPFLCSSDSKHFMQISWEEWKVLAIHTKRNQIQELRMNWTIDKEWFLERNSKDTNAATKQSTHNFHSRFFFV